MSFAKWQVLQWAGRLVKYATLSALSDKFGFGYVKPPKEDVTQGEQSTQQRVRLMQWFGFRSSPVVAGGEAIVVAPRGGATNAVAVVVDNLKYGPTDLKEGETAMYDKAGNVIRQSQDGTKVDAATSKDIVLNAGSHSVARVGDHARVTLRSSWVQTSPSPPTFQFTLSVLQGTSVTVVFQIVALGVVSIPAVPGVPYDVEVDSEIFEGADHVKA